MKPSFQRQFILFQNCQFKGKTGQNKHIVEAIGWGSPLELLTNWCDFILIKSFSMTIYIYSIKLVLLIMWLLISKDRTQVSQYLFLC